MKPDAETRLVYQAGADQVTTESSSDGRRATTKPRPRAAARRYLPRLMISKPKPCGVSRARKLSAGAGDGATDRIWLHDCIKIRVLAPPHDL